MFSISSCNSRGGAPLCTTCEPAGLADEAGGRDSSSSTTGVSTSNPLPAGTLTAGVWDDNLNFEFFSSYLSTVTLGGVPTFSRNDRVVFRLHSASGAPLVGAHVEISQTGSRLVAVDSAADGTVVFLPSFMGATDQAPLDVTVTAVGGAQTHKQVPPTAAMYEVTVDQAPDQAETGIDIAIVLDTTGSMGDEIGYLQSEVDSIATDVSNRFANLPQRWALVLYRDEGDDYLTQVTDFTSLEAFKTALGTATATGGGDTPEAVDEALSQVPKLSWRTGAVTRLAFHVADAPHHAEKTARVEASLRDIISHSVRYYPIASSGVDEVFE